jgi:flagellar basal-body rod protein FlgG
MKAPHIAVTGMKAFETITAVIANNFANINTYGYRKQVAVFQDLIYQIEKRPGDSSSADGTIRPNGVSLGLGTELVGTFALDKPGDLEPTGSQYNFAFAPSLSSRGFFTIQLPDGTIAYSRNGNFQPSATGEIVTSEGFLVLPGITVPKGTTALSCDANGNLYAQVNNNTATAPELIGAFGVVDFLNPTGLQPIGSNLFLQTPASGEPIAGTAGKEGLAQIKQGFLEKSNVSAVDELTNLITAQRGYEMCSKVIKVADEMSQVVNRLVQ